MIKARAVSPVTKSPTSLGNGSPGVEKNQRPKDIKQACLTYVQEREHPKLPEQIRDLFEEGDLYLTAGLRKDTDEQKVHLTVRSSRQYHSILVEYVGWVLENFVCEHFPNCNFENDIKVRIKKERQITNEDLGADPVKPRRDFSFLEGIMAAFNDTGNANLSGVENE